MFCLEFLYKINFQMRHWSIRRKWLNKSNVLSLNWVISALYTFESSWRRPRDSWCGCGRDMMGQPLSRVQRRSTHRPPRLHTALQLGSRQHDSQHVAPPLPTARGCQPRVMMLPQWIPSTPPVTRQRFADTPGKAKKEEETMMFFTDVQSQLRDQSLTT